MRTGAIDKQREGEHFRCSCPSATPIGHELVHSPTSVRGLSQDRETERGTVDPSVARVSGQDAAMDSLGAHVRGECASEGSAVVTAASDEWSPVRSIGGNLLLRAISSSRPWARAGAAPRTLRRRYGAMRKRRASLRLLEKLEPGSRAQNWQKTS